MERSSRKPTSTRRREIAGAALRLAGERGAAGLTAAAIAAEVGLTSGALFRHFDSIDSILEAAVACAASLVQTTFPSSSLTPFERLEFLVTTRVALLSEHPGLVWMLHSDQAAARIPYEARSCLIDLAARTRAELGGAVHAARAAGELRDDVAPEAQVTILIGSVHALARRGASDPGPILAGVFEMLRPPSV